MNEEDSDAEDSDGDGGAKRGRVTAHYIVHRSSGIEEDDGRRDPGREDGRALVAHRVSACGAANFEEVPGREQYGAGDDATAQCVEDMLAFHEENFHYDEGIEVRSMDRHELEVKEEERRGGKEKRRKESKVYVYNVRLYIL